MGKDFDFCGWATRNDICCSDGRTIRKDAFKDCDGTIVPLVWNHQHDDVHSVLGHALLENRDEGVFMYGYLNDTESGDAARKLVHSGDITALSIYANKLKQKGGDVLHGVIREVSLVLAGANPKATIEPLLAHGDGSDEEAHICMGEELNALELFHSEESAEEEVVEEIEPETTEEVVEEEPVVEEETVEATESEAEEEVTEEVEDIEHSDSSEEDKEKETMADKEKTVQEVWDGMSEEEQKVAEFIGEKMVEDALAEAGVAIEEGDTEEMNHNVFENDERVEVLSHADMTEILTTEWKKCGSLAEAVKARIGEGTLMHADGDDPTPQTYGIEHIDYLFPEAKNVMAEPQFIKRNMDWVGVVMSGVHHTPFSRIKSIFADITADEARAKGYIKGNLKKEEVFPLLKRTTTPTTVYKKQKLDKDDIKDITDFNVVVWLKKEMRFMLDEELARAFLIGDGREADEDDKINEQNIRPIWTDNELYTINQHIVLASNATYDEKCNAVIDAVIVGDEDYEGSGNKIIFCDKWFLTRSMLMRNGIGERVYKSVNELASEMGVNRIVPVAVMKNKTRVVSGVTRKLVAIVVDLNDYNVGADGGAPVDLFDDFDIDRNQEKYLIETRCSGALIKPKSAIAVEMSFQ